MSYVNDTHPFQRSRLRQARLDARVSEERVADAAGVTARTIKNWEDGTGEPSATQLKAISVLTGKPLDFFYKPPRAA